MAQEKARDAAFDPQKGRTDPHEIMRALLYLGFTDAAIARIGRLGQLSPEAVTDKEIDAGLAGKSQAAHAAELVMGALTHPASMGLPMMDVLRDYQRQQQSSALVLHGQADVQQAVGVHIAHLEIPAATKSALTLALSKQLTLFGKSILPSDRPWEECLNHDHRSMQECEWFLRNQLADYPKEQEAARETSRMIHEELIYRRLKAHPALQDAIYARLSGHGRDARDEVEVDALVQDAISVYVSTVASIGGDHGVREAVEGLRNRLSTAGESQVDMQANLLLQVIAQSAQSEPPRFDMLRLQAQMLQREHYANSMSNELNRRDEVSRRNHATRKSDALPKQLQELMQQLTQLPNYLATLTDAERDALRVQMQEAGFQLKEADQHFDHARHPPLGQNAKCRPCDMQWQHFVRVRDSGADQGLSGPV